MLLQNAKSLVYDLFKLLYQEMLFHYINTDCGSLESWLHHELCSENLYLFNYVHADIGKKKSFETLVSEANSLNKQISCVHILFLHLLSLFITVCLSKILKNTDVFGMHLSITNFITNCWYLSICQKQNI